MTGYLLDTHVLLWAAQDSPSLGAEARAIIDNRANDIFVSVASLWELVIKGRLGRADFRVDPRRLRERALRAGLGELPIRATHALEVGELPPVHSDPFDRILLAQARVEELILLTSDQKLLEYGSPARRV